MKTDEANPLDWLAAGKLPCVLSKSVAMVLGYNTGELI
jgi:hypothetical protein